MDPPAKINPRDRRKQILKDAKEKKVAEKNMLSNYQIDR